jgi:peptidoglycan/xylan/chitin deacetylase (PgdA/CDA1 family)
VIGLPRAAAQLLKRSAERILVLAGPAALARRLASSSTLVLAYHNIVPDGEVGGSDRSLHLPQRQFAAHLERLTGTHDVVPLGDVLLDKPRSPGRPRAVITFDDGYAGALSAGVAELRRFGVPATFFVTPGRLGRQVFWWDRLGVLGDGEVPPDMRNHALTALRGEDEAISAWAGSRALSAAAVPECAKSGTEVEVTEALTVPGINVAAHTWSHPNLAALDAAALERELERPLEWLRARWPDTLPFVSYPYGLASPAVMAAAQRAGYRAGLLVSGGWLPPRWEEVPFLLPRVNIPSGISTAGFELLASGLVRR